MQEYNKVNPGPPPSNNNPPANNNIPPKKTDRQTVVGWRRKRFVEIFGLSWPKGRSARSFVRRIDLAGTNLEANYVLSLADRSCELCSGTTDRDNHVMVSRVRPFDSAGPGVDVALASDIGYLTRRTKVALRLSHRS